MAIIYLWLVQNAGGACRSLGGQNVMCIIEMRKKKKGEASFEIYIQTQTKNAHRKLHTEKLLCYRHPPSAATAAERTNSTSVRIGRPDMPLLPVYD